MTGEACDASDTTSVRAVYRWLADGTKAGVKGGTGVNGFEYLGSLVYQRSSGDLKLESGAFGGGRIQASEGASGPVYTPLYYETDHLGSVRSVINGFTGEMVEYNDYYPFGMHHPNPNYTVSSNNNLARRPGGLQVRQPFESSPMRPHNKIPP